MAFSQAACCRHRARSGQGLDGGSKAAFMTSGLVFVNDVFIGNTIDSAGCRAEQVFRGGFIASLDCLAYTFDRRAHHGTHAGVVLVTGDRLAGALAGLGGISHYSETFPVTGEL